MSIEYSRQSKKEELKKELLQLLDDGDVRKRIREIMRSEQISEPAAERRIDDVARLGPRNAVLEEKVQEFRGKWESLQKEHESLKDQYKEKENDWIKERDGLYSDLERTREEHRRNTADWEQERAKLHSDLDHSRRDHQRDLENWEEERQRLRSDLDSSRKEHQRDADEWRERERSLIGRMDAQQAEIDRLGQALEPFSPLLEIYQSYCTLSLPGGLKESLCESLPDDSAVRFWAAACQQDTLTRFWDTVKSSCESLSEQQCGTLCDILQFAIDQYNSIWTSPIYELIADGAGKSFDELRHARSSKCSVYSGEIKRVLLPGIWNLRLGKAERKSIVEY